MDLFRGETDSAGRKTAAPAFLASGTRGATIEARAA